MGKRLLPLVGITLLSSVASATPNQVVIIRHAEKPVTGNNVNQQGCERAFLLPDFFHLNPTVNQFGSPVAFYGARPTAKGGSIRSLETIAPTASSYGMQIQASFDKTQPTQAAQAILSNPAYNGKTVVMAWEHGAIPGLAQAFGLTLTPTLQVWPDAVFDEAWVLDFTSGTPSIQIIPEDVLPGDNTVGGLGGWQNPPTIPGTSTIPADVIQKCVDDSILDQLTHSISTPAI